MNNNNLAVETFGLTKAYKGVFAVDNINLKVPKGSICGFLGKNGAGKTTTIKMVTGLIRPTAGDYAVMGTQKENLTKGAKSVGYLPDVPDFYGYMNGGEFLRLCGRLCNISDKELRSHVPSLLKQVGLDGVKTKISGYSRGMRQRLGIAQALINSPPVVFMDEPVSALDPMGRRDVMEIISNLRAASGTTVVFSTHILADVESICDYVAIIHRGKMIAQDSIDNIKRGFAKNLAEVTFYEQEHREKFEQAIKKSARAVITESDAESIKTMLSIDSDTQELGKITASILADIAVPFESFNMHAPSLDDIFYEMTVSVDNASKGEGGQKI